MKLSENFSIDYTLGPGYKPIFPSWIPGFGGKIMMVNGKVWPFMNF
jgi:hypothetical protein